MKRQRGRSRKGSNNNHNNNNHSHGNRSFDSNGPEVKVRGNASQVYEKYIVLARDATSSGNRVKAENLRQHAEHYFRINTEQEAAKAAAREEADARREKQNANQSHNQNQNHGQSSNDGDTKEGTPIEGNENKGRSRRQPQRAPRNNDADTKTETAKPETVKSKPVKSETQEALEVVKPEAGDVVAAKDEAPKPTRRRKAPTKPKAKPDTAVDAAE